MGKRSFRALWLMACAAFALVAMGACTSMEKTKEQSTAAKLPVIEGATYVGSEACADCHEDVVNDFKHTIHGKLAGFELKANMAQGGACEACHGPASKHIDEEDPEYIINPANLSPQQQSAICLKCHTDGEVMDWRGSEHALNDVSCLNCHDPHGKKDAEAYRDKLGYKHKHVKDTQLKKPEPELCFTCHKDIMAKTNYPNHHPIKEGKMTCSECHNPHGSTVEPLLRTDERKNELCFECHADKQGPFAFEHAPVEEDCTICHDPHGSVADNLLKQNEPYLCIQCHGLHFHSAIQPDTDWLKQNGAKGPLATMPNGHSMQKIMTSRCTECHPSIHGSDLPSLSAPGGGSRLTR